MRDESTDERRPKAIVTPGWVRSIDSAVSGMNHTIPFPWHNLVRPLDAITFHVQLSWPRPGCYLHRPSWYPTFGSELLALPRVPSPFPPCFLEKHRLRTG